MADLTFVDLEIRLFPREEAGYPVELTLGDEREFPRGWLAADIVPWTATGDPAADGARLLAALLADPVLQSAWAEARGAAPQRRLRLRLDPRAPELHTLPWELLCDETAVLAANANTPFSRYLPVALPWGSLVEERPLRVLVAISNPSDLETTYRLAPLDVPQEQATLTAALAAAGSGIQVQFLEPPVTLARLEEALRAGYHVFHYLGHGVFDARRDQAALYLQRDDGTADRVTDDALIGVLTRLAVRPRLVFLAACQSASRAAGDAFRGLGPQLVAAGVPAVVAMQDSVTLAAAQKLSAVFYQRVAEHGLVDCALNEARSALLTAGAPAAAVPVLFLRLKSGRLWDPAADARGTVLGEKNPRIFWSGLLRLIQEQRCTPIIGPRVHGRWLPQPAEIAQRWAADHDYPFADPTALARVAQYLATNQGEDFPRYEYLAALQTELLARLPAELRPARPPETLTALMQAVGWPTFSAADPNEPHRVLASLGLPLYLTTNVDSFMVEALRAQGRQPVREYCRWHPDLDLPPSRLITGYEPTPAAPLVYHLFGSDEEAGSLVLTEDDYLAFLVRIAAERDRIPNLIRGALASSALLFVGFNLYDWEFRVVLHGLVAGLDRRRKFKHVAVQLEFDAAGAADTTAVQAFLQQYFQEADINVFWGTSTQFLAELREQRM